MTEKQRERSPGKWEMVQFLQNEGADRYVRLPETKVIVKGKFTGDAGEVWGCVCQTG